LRLDYPEGTSVRNFLIVFGEDIIVEMIEVVSEQKALNKANRSERVMIRDAFPIILYLFLSPFYFFPSGQPQIADFVLILGVAFVIMRNHGIIWPKSFFVRVYYLFLINIVLVNLLTAFFLQTTGPVLPTLYYIYNAIVVFFILSLFVSHGGNMLKAILWSVSISSLFQFALIVARMDFTRFRQVGFFNNPNQLGYYSLINLALIAITSQKVRVSRSFLSVILLVNIFLAMLSNSKAALISSIFIILPLLLRFLSRRKYKRTSMTLLLFIIPVLLIFFLVYGSSIVSSMENLVQNTQRRLSTIGMDSDDDLLGRGYGRIALYPEFTLYGAAEGIGPGNDPRYDDPYMGSEIHSTFGTLLFSYGFVGLVTFLIMLIIATDWTSLVSITSVAAISFYSLTHQGLRFTNVWIFLVVAFLMKTGAGNNIADYSLIPRKTMK